MVQPNGKGIALKRDILISASRLDEIAVGDGAAVSRMAQQILHDDADLVFGLLGQNPYSSGVLKLLLSGASAFGFGPSIRYANDKGWLVALKWQKDFVVNNRPAGSQIFLKAAIPL
ncbi:hypothetical protein [Xenorhabdus littoralis]|uniref:hypothetical protein n=1 Tax=Xenorhabdus littoralis TaxID=2582835 RepID=UPI0029E80E73|nr:hypothetical protein [Xenorhabdus sp. psl]